jgi:hypothetical protein
VGYARHQSAQREVIDAHPTDDVDDTSAGPVFATVLKRRLPACPGAARGRFSAAPGKRTVASALRAVSLERTNGASAVSTVCSTVPCGRLGRQAASCWGCSWKPSCPKENRCFWASTRRCRGGGQRRYLLKASTETRCAQAVSTSSRGVLSDGYF